MTETATLPTIEEMQAQVLAESPPPPGTAASDVPVIQVTNAPVAEPGSSTTEFKLVTALGALITSGTALYGALVASGVLHADQATVEAVVGFGASLVTVLTLGYTFARSLRKAGTAG